jgi:Uri superfamily endonuclease
MPAAKFVQSDRRKQWRIDYLFSETMEQLLTEIVQTSSSVVSFADIQRSEEALTP